MIKNIEKVYDDFVSNNFIIYDKKQIEALNKIEIIWNNFKKFRLFFRKKKPFGIYIYGAVGIGKTFIIKIFIQSISRSKKIHFNHLMIDVHAYINNSLKDVALETYIKNLSKNLDVIFIDELHIFNIVDAMLIKKIFLLLIKNKTFIIVSSNFKPNQLYKDGLQRNDFMIFISLIETNFETIHLNNINDYRRQMLNQSKTYFTPINKITSEEFYILFDRLVDKSEIYIKKIQSKSRVIRFEKSTSNVVLCTFSELCEANLAHTDYLNIAKEFKLIFLSEVPIFELSKSNECRRFISLIDMLYDQKCSIVILAEKPINELCKINKFKTEFERTSSRLYEMTMLNSKKE